jgi:hypothetical protein
MAHIDWVLVADLAYFDQRGRLCTVGVVTKLLVPSLPVVVRQIMMVARVSAPSPGEEIGMGVAVLTPTGQWAEPDDPDGVQIEVAAEYLLVTLRDLPIVEEGTYRFAVYLDEQTMAVEVPVCLPTSRRHAEVH